MSHFRYNTSFLYFAILINIWLLLVFLLNSALNNLHPEQLSLLGNVPSTFEKRDSLPKTDSNGAKPPGYNGGRVKLSAKEASLAKDTFSLNEFNLVASDKIGFRRQVPDLRNQRCQKKTYPPDLPTVSLIIIFHNEALSSLLRTVTSCYDRVAERLLKEIILVDDLSDREDVGAPLQFQLSHNFSGKARVYRTPARQGLIKARIYGSNFANGEALVFLDSHCECGEGWAEPILYEIKKDYRTAVQPNIGFISKNTFEFSAEKQVHSQGNFDWSLLFKWRRVPPHDERLRQDEADPVRTPTMAGGLFGISKEWWEHLGKYDPGFELWGGENLEISIKSWLCGGSVVITPCSIIGHVFRSKHPYHWYKDGPDQAFTANARRLAEVWLDGYKDIFYISAGDYIKQVPMGDISHRLALKERLKCRDFKWYLEEVVRDIYVPSLNIVLAGTLANEGNPSGPQCLDSYQEDHGAAKVYPCHYLESQRVDFSDKEEIRFKASYCLEATTSDTGVAKRACNGNEMQKWMVEQKQKRIIHKDTGQCLTYNPEDNPKSIITISDCRTNSTSQSWVFKQKSDNKKSAS